MTGRHHIPLLLGLVLTAAPGVAGAAPPRDIPVVVHPVECVSWRCGAGFRNALTDRITSALTKGRKFKPVDRGNLQKALGEQLKCRKGIRKGIISRECLIQAGRVMQARKMITGRLVKIGTKNNYQLTLGITDLATVKNERSVSEDCWGCGQRALLGLADRATDLLTGFKKGSGKRPPRPAVGGGGEEKLPPVAPELGNLRVEGSPRGARLLVKGPAGFKGPGRATLPRTWQGVPAGTYEIKVWAEDHKAQKARVVVVPDRTGLASVDLIKNHGTLTVGGKPPGALVVVTGPRWYRKKWGLTAGHTLRRVPNGSYTVTVSRTGYAGFQKQVQVTGNEARVDVALKTAEAARAAGRVVKGTAGMAWVRIPGGSFQMGSTRGTPDERPVHTVKLATFRLSKTEVTVAQYRACVAAGRCSSPGTGPLCNWAHGGREAHPINCVSWKQARTFCAWSGGRLPSESQWEYAARSAGRAIVYPWGDATATCTQAIMGHPRTCTDGDPCGCRQNRTWPVCSRPAGNTAQGLCDMAGNTWEWIADCWYKSYTGAPGNGRARNRGKCRRRFMRGGSWGSRADSLRAAFRYRFPPHRKYHEHYGFRCAK